MVLEEWLRVTIDSRDGIFALGPHGPNVGIPSMYMGLNLLKPFVVKVHL
jgi:hypothetical protein